MYDVQEIRNYRDLACWPYYFKLFKDGTLSYNPFSGYYLVRNFIFFKSRFNQHSTL